MTDEETPEADAAPTADGLPRRSRWRTFGIVCVTIVVLAAAVGVGVVAGRLTTASNEGAGGQSGVEASPEADKLPQGNGPSPAFTMGDSVPNPGALLVPATSPSRPVFLTAADGLSDTATTASGYRLVNAGISGGQVAAVLASVFGVTGQPVTQEGRWVVGTPEGPGPSLIVTDDPFFRWTFDGGTLPPSTPAPPATPTPLASPPATPTPLGTATSLATPTPVATTPPPMTADRAVELAAALLGSIGVDTASVDWQVNLQEGVTLVTAWQVLAGARTQLAWQVGFGPAGELVRAAGFSAGFEEVPEYPVVGAATAVARAGQPPWSAIGPAAVTPADSDAGTSPTTPGAPDDRPQLSVPVTNVNVTGADLALAQYWQPDGGLLVLPSYLLTGDDGSRWSLLAVDESGVDFVEAPYPTAPAAAP